MRGKTRREQIIGEHRREQIRFIALCAASLVLVLYRVLMAAVLLAPAVFLHHREELGKIHKRDLLLCSVSGAFLGLHFAAYFESLHFTSVAAAVVLADTEVFFVALGSILFLRHKLSRKACIQRICNVIIYKLCVVI